MILLILKILMQGYQKLIKNHAKTLIFTILDILQRKKIDDCINIISVTPLYLGITHVNGYIEEKGMDKCLFFDSTDEKKELPKKYDVFNEIRDKIQEINNNECDYEKD